MPRCIFMVGKTGGCFHQDGRPPRSSFGGGGADGGDRTHKRGASAIPNATARKVAAFQALGGVFPAETHKYLAAKEKPSERPKRCYRAFPVLRRLTG